MAIEDCQRQFTRIFEGMGLTPLSSKVTASQITTLLEHRMRSDLINRDFQNNQRLCELWSQYAKDEYSLTNW